MMFTPPLLRSRHDIPVSLPPVNIKFVEARQSRHINIILRRQPLPVLPWTMPTIGHEQCQNTTKEQRIKKEKKVLKGYRPTAGLSTQTKVPTSWYRVVSREEPAILQSMPQACGLPFHRVSFLLPRRTASSNDPRNRLGCKSSHEMEPRVGCRLPTCVAVSTRMARRCSCPTFPVLQD